MGYDDEQQRALERHEHPRPLEVHVHLDGTVILKDDLSAQVKQLDRIRSKLRRHTARLRDALRRSRTTTED